MIRFKILRMSDGIMSPGSSEARARDCACPVAENRSGTGWDVSDDRTVTGFWIAEACPLHGSLVQP